MNRRHTMVGAAVVVVVVGVGLHLLGLASLRQISHDDVISILAATGHQGEYQAVVDTTAYPVATWVPTAEWQRFVQVEDRLPLLRITRDLGHEDIHPPAYFWLLHVWILVVGVSLWAGPALNLLIHAVTAVALWRLARTVFGDPRAAWAVAGLWATLPAVVVSSLNTRQYSLAGLCAVLLCDQVIRLDDGPRRRRLALVGGLTALGLLTLYTFGYLVVGLGAVLGVRLRDRHRRRAALEGLGAQAAGGVLFLAAQPWLREVLARQRDQAEPFSSELLALRVSTLWNELPRFLLADARGITGAAVLLAALAVAAVVVGWWRRGTAAAKVVIWLALWTSGLLLVSYLAAVSPGAAYEPRYFTIALPFVAFLPVLALWRVRHKRPITVTATVLAAAVLTANGAFWLREARQPEAETLSTQFPVVIDNLARGVLLRILWDAPSQMPVYAADQSTLLLTESRWLDCHGDPLGPRPPARWRSPAPCAGAPVVYVSQVQYEATEDGRAAILAQAQQTRDVTRIGGIGDIADRYWLTPRVAQAQRPREARQWVHHPPLDALVPAGSRR